jgi:hypothetical protein
MFVCCHLSLIQNVFPAHYTISEPNKHTYQTLSSSLARTYHINRDYHDQAIICV